MGKVIELKKFLIEKDRPAIEWKDPNLRTLEALDTLKTYPKVNSRDSRIKTEFTCLLADLTGALKTKGKVRDFYIRRARKTRDELIFLRVWHKLCHHPRFLELIGDLPEKKAMDFYKDM